MKTELKLQVVWRIFWRVALFAGAGAVLIGPLAIILLTNYISPIYPLEPVFDALGLFYGAFCLGLPGYLTAQRRDCNEALQMAIGGALGGILSGAILGVFSSLALALFAHFDRLAQFNSISALVGALIGALYTSLHPKYKPREELLLLLEPREIEYSNDNTEH